MEEFTYYSKNDQDLYAFFYSAGDKTAWAVHMPRLPAGLTGVGKGVGSLENIGNKDEAYKKLKEMVDKL